MVGNDVWLGLDAVVMPGVRLGDGCIVAAKSVVTKSFEPYSIIGGNPARLIRKRFDDGLIALLLRFAWWDRSPKEVTSLLPLLTCSDIEAVRRKLVELTS